MDYKLKAISNNVNNNDTIVDLISKMDDNKEQDASKEPPDHVCERNVPVLFATMQGINLRKFNKHAVDNYSIQFCDLERWVSHLLCH